METTLTTSEYMTSNTVNIRIADWTRFPGGRFKEHGENSGQEFREQFLESNVSAGYSFNIDFNGIFTVGWSFLDESLGHYVESLGLTEFRKRFRIIADDDPDILQELETVIEGRTKKR